VARASKDPPLVAALRDKRADVESLLVAAATGPDPIGDLLLVVNARGLTNAVRIAALEALAPSLSPSDAGEIGRAAGKQREDVARRAVELLGSLGGTEAAYVLRRIFGERPDSVAEKARVLASALTKEGAPTTPRERLFALLLAEEERQADHAVDESVATQIEELDASFQAVGRTAAGLNTYQRVLRDDLHALVLLAEPTVSENVLSRALDTPLRSYPADRLRSLLRAAPAPVTTEIGRRALGRSRRRDSDDNARQAEAVLDLLVTRSDVRRQLRDEVFDCLSDTDPALVLASIRAIADAREQLAVNQREEVVQRYASLDGEPRAEAAAALRDWGPDVRRQRDPELLALWIRAAAGSDADVRFGEGVDALSEDWIEESGMRLLLDAVAAPLSQLDESVREDAEVELARSLVRWLSLAASSTVLVGNAQFDSLAVSHLDDVFIPGLVADDAVALALALIDEAATPETALGGVLRQFDSPAGARLLERTAIGHAPAWTALALAASPAQLRGLIHARLAAIRRTVRSLDDLARAREQASTEALTSRRDLVLKALADAEKASAGNSGILDQLGVIRAAVGGLEGGAETAKASQAVEDWRAGAAQRWSFVDHQPEGLVIREYADDLQDLVLELDGRAYARGVTPAADRPHYAADLERAVSVLAAAAAGPGGPGWSETVAALRGRPELAMRIWRAWGRAEPKPAFELLRRLEQARPGPEALPALDALLRVVDDDALRSGARELSETSLASVFALLGDLLQQSVRARDRLRAEVAREEGNAARRIADQLNLPFLALEGIVFGYFRLRALLGEAGWCQVEASLGDTISDVHLDPSRHDIRGAEGATQYVVRSLGIQVDGQAVVRAIVEGQDD
jgi:hypothetical protein